MNQRRAVKAIDITPPEILSALQSLQRCPLVSITSYINPIHHFLASHYKRILQEILCHCKLITVKGAESLDRHTKSSQSCGLLQQPLTLILKEVINSKSTSNKSCRNLFFLTSNIGHSQRTNMTELNKESKGLQKIQPSLVHMP